MAAGNFDRCLKFVLQFEGGFVNDPRDPGGATNLGVTIGTLSAVLGRKATIADVKKLTPTTVAPIYKQRYWDQVAGDDLPEGVDLAVFDFGVNSGPARAVIALQQILGLGDDGITGPITIAAAKQAEPKNTILSLSAHRLAFLQRLTVFEAFGPGLTNRVTKCKVASLAMVAQDASRNMVTTRFRTLAEAKAEFLESSPEARRSWEATAPRRALSAMLVQARLRARLSQRDLASITGWDKGFLSRLESATDGFPSVKTLMTFLSACGERLGIATFRDERMMGLVAIADDEGVERSRARAPELAGAFRATSRE